MEPTSSQFPISHVKVHPGSMGYGAAAGKYDTEGNTDEWRIGSDERDREDIKKYNEALRNANETSVVKINSGAKINGENY
jgi:hypothetical protein